MDNTSRGAIIDQLIQHGSLSRNEIAQRTGLSRSVITVSTLELLRQEVIQKDGTAPSTGGRRPSAFRLGGGRHLVIGVALEEDEGHVAAYALDGQRVDGGIERLPSSRTPPEIVDHVARRVRTLQGNHPSAIVLGCGIALPSIVDAETDLVTSNTYRWQELPLRQLLESATGLPVSVLDNVHAAALGELWIGGRGIRQNLLYLYVGRGVGGAIIVNRKLYFGRNHAAGEFGPMIIGGSIGDEPFFGKFDVLAHQSTLIDEIEQVRDRYPPSRLPERVLPDDFYPILAEAVAQEDALALAIQHRLVIYTATLCANLVNSLNPDEIIIGGQVAALGPNFVEMVHRTMRDWTLPLPYTSLRILTASHRSVSMPLGAAASMIQRTAELLDNHVGA